MAIEVDTRDPYHRQDDEETASKLDELAGRVSSMLPGKHTVRVQGINPLTRTAKAVVSSEATADDLPLVDRAIEHVERLAELLTPPDALAPRFTPEPEVFDLGRGGRRMVHLHQEYQGIPVFQAVRSVLFDRSGAVQEVEGDHVPIIGRPDVVPTLPAEEAVMRAARHVGTQYERRDQNGAPAVRVSPYPATVLVEFPLTCRPTVLRKRPFEDPIAAHLVLLYLGRDVKLGWRIPLVLSEPPENFEIIVAANGAEPGTILYCKSTAWDVAASGRVHRHGFADGQVESVSFPPPAEEFPPIEPPDPRGGFLRDWVDDNRKKRAKGNNVALAGAGLEVVGTPTNGVVSFSAPTRDGNVQKGLDAFYTCNYLHDFFYLLGFDESKRNFQSKNFTGRGRGGDAVQVEINNHSERTNMRPANDGVLCRMTLGVWPKTRRHTALDGDVVIHEYTHGVTARLIGKRQFWSSSLAGLEGQALDEGYCDYFALVIQNYRRLLRDPAAKERWVFGAWVAQDDRTGVRSHAYGASFPGRYSDLGTDGYDRAHDAGQIWCEALCRINRGLGRALGDRRRGHEIGLQLVVHSLGLLPRSFSLGFQDGRKKILEALDDVVEPTGPSRLTGEPLIPIAQRPMIETEIVGAFNELGI